MNVLKLIPQLAQLTTIDCCYCSPDIESCCFCVTNLKTACLLMFFCRIITACLLIGFLLIPICTELFYTNVGGALNVFRHLLFAFLIIHAACCSAFLFGLFFSLAITVELMIISGTLSSMIGFTYALMLIGYYFRDASCDTEGTILAILLLDVAPWPYFMMVLSTIKRKWCKEYQ